MSYGAALVLIDVQLPGHLWRKVIGEPTPRAIEIEGGCNSRMLAFAHVKSKRPFRFDLPIAVRLDDCALLLDRVDEREQGQRDPM